MPWEQMEWMLPTNESFFELPKFIHRLHGAHSLVYLASDFADLSYGVTN
jgi:hypothetical protein